MARSIDEIFQEIQTEKNSMSVLVTKLLNSDGSTTLNTEQDLLDELQSTNKVSIWKLWSYLTAVEMNFEEQLWDEFKTELEEIKDATPVYNKQWWSERGLEFQTGYVLEIDPDDNSVSYSTIDESAQIIGSCTVSDLSGKVILKIRGKNSDLLTASQKTEFTTYINTLKPVGDRVIINNFNADDIKLYYDIYYNALEVSTVKSEVESVINNYLENLGFSSEINITDLTDLLQVVNGVVDPVFVEAYGKHSGSSYNSFSNYYDTIAGYAAIDSGFPLSSTINYIVKN